MTSIIILEGIPTSGKSILSKKIKSILQSDKKSVEYISDNEINTVFNRKQNRKDHTPAVGAPQYLKEIMQKKLLKNSQYIISHGFHFFYLTTNISRGEKETLHKEYHEVESMLELYPTLIVYLNIETRYILHSFQKRFSWNDSQGKVDPFKEFVEAKGSEFAQLAYYQKKQNLYKDLIKESKLHSLILNIKKETSYDDLALRIVQKMHEIEGGFGL